jgi:hypothetical protein
VAAPSIVEHLRPKPFRGDVIAAGIVVLVTLVWLLEGRFDDDWRAGVHLLYAVLATGLAGVLAALAPMEREAPRAYQSVLYVATFTLAIAALMNLADVLGAAGSLGGAGARAWAFSALAALALVFATRRNSAVSTLLGALSGGVAVLSFVQWAFDAGSAATARWVLLGLMVVFAFAALGQRDRHRPHGVALVDAAGAAVAVIGVTLLTEAIFGGMAIAREGEGPYEATVAWGWELVLLGAGFGLIAYSSVDRERGPAYLGVLCLIEFVLLASSGGFAGWPLILLAIALALLVIGLRPTTPAPPAPDADAPPAPTEPLRRDGAGT